MNSSEKPHSAKALNVGAFKVNNHVSITHKVIQNHIEIEQLLKKPSHLANKHPRRPFALLSTFSSNPKSQDLNLHKSASQLQLLSYCAYDKI